MTDSRIDRYEYCRKALREKVGLSARESRTYLMMDWEVPESVAKEWKISMDELNAIAKRADEKVIASGLSEKDLFGDKQVLTMFITPAWNEIRNS